MTEIAFSSIHVPTWQEGCSCFQSQNKKLTVLFTLSCLRPCWWLDHVVQIVSPNQGPEMWNIMHYIKYANFLLWNTWICHFLAISLIITNAYILCLIENGPGFAESWPSSPLVSIFFNLCAIFAFCIVRNVGEIPGQCSWMYYVYDWLESKANGGPMSWQGGLKDSPEYGMKKVMI